MKGLLGLCLCVFLSSACFAEDSKDLPANLIKVDKVNNPSCVEFVIFKGQLYCSTEAMDKSSPDPKLLDYEGQRIQFDGRAWKLAWGQKTDTITTLEYIPVGQQIEQWQELITSQFIPMQAVNLKNYVAFIKDNLAKSVSAFKFTILEDKPNQIICEFSVQKPSNLIQNELFKVTKTAKGIYVLHYAVKKDDMGTAERKKWLDLLKSSRVLQ